MYLCFTFKPRSLFVPEPLGFWRPTLWKTTSLCVFLAKQLFGKISPCSAAHQIFTSLQIEEEITAALDFVKYIYGLLGFTFTLKLSTRPDDYMGDINLWNKAEEVCVVFGLFCLAGQITARQLLWISMLPWEQF